MASQSANLHPHIAAGDHKAYMLYALEQARRSPPGPTNYCVGAVLVDADKNEIISTGWSLELPDPTGSGTTHAEQCCFIKVGQQHNLPEERIAEVLPRNTTLYTTMEPCNKRLSGSMSCVDRILRLGKGIKEVCVGVKEPEAFVDQSILVVGRKRLAAAGISVFFVEGLEDQILEVAKSGH